MNPFDTNPEEVAFKWPQWEKYLEMLLHFCHYSQNLVLVVGEHGSGKSTLLRHLRQECSTVSLCKELQGSAHVEPDIIFNTLLQAYQLPFMSLSEGVSDQHIHKVLANIESNEQTCVLLIDNADQLPDASLTLLLKLISQQNPHESYLHVVLFGDSRLTHRCYDLAKPLQAEHFLHMLPLAGLSVEECRDYLNYCVQRSGVQNPVPWTDDEVEEIHLRAKGLIGNIQQLAKVRYEQEGEESVVPDVLRVEPSESAPLMQQHRNKIVGSVVFVFALLAVTVFMNREPAQNNLKLVQPAPVVLDQPKPQVAPPASTPTLTLTPTPTPTTPTAALPVKTEIAVENPASKAPENSPASPTDAKPVPESLQVASAEIKPDVPEDNTSDAPAPSPAPASELKVAEKNAQDVDPAIEASKPAKVESQSKSRAHKKSVKTSKISKKEHKVTTVSKSEKGKYTLQLFATRQEAAAKKFIANNHLANKAHYVAVKRKGENWYAVVYGGYPTQLAAQSAVKQLPDNVKALHPWPKQSTLNG